MKKELAAGLWATGFLCGSVDAQGHSGWQFNQGQGGTRHELTYIPAGDHHPEIFMHCRQDEGFVFVEFSVERHAPTETLNIGNVSVSVPASYDDDPHFDWDVATIALPADHLVFRELSNGSPLRIRAATYALATAAERRNATNFVRACQLALAG
jgi:hypothetical protein